MTRLQFVYSWEITVMNDVMGFAKHLTAEGQNYKDAIERAMGQLSEKRYNPADFSVTEIHRKAIVRRAAA